MGHLWTLIGIHDIDGLPWVSHGRLRVPRMPMGAHGQPMGFQGFAMGTNGFLVVSRGLLKAFIGIHGTHNLLRASHGRSWASKGHPLPPIGLWWAATRVRRPTREFPCIFQGFPWTSTSLFCAPMDFLWAPVGSYVLSWVARGHP